MISNSLSGKLGSVLNSGTLHAELVDILNLHDGPGNRYYVSSGSGNATNSGTSWNAALSTLDAAVNKCTPNNGDVILIAPDHAETLIADSGVDIDVAGVTVIGLGNGSSRPTFTFTTAVTADFKLAAAGVKVKNLLFKAGIDALTGPIEVSADDCAVIDCEYQDDATNNYETVDVLVTGGDNTADRLVVDRFVYRHEGGTGGTQIQAVLNIGVQDGVEIRNCFIACDGATGGIECGNSTHLHIHHNYIESTHANDVCITLGSTSTGLIHDNRLKIATDVQTTWITATNDCALFENYGVNADAETGGLIGTVST